MKTLAVLLLVLGLTSCDSVVSRTPHPDRAYQRASTQSCSTGPGYCCEYGLGFNGKWEYSCGMKYSCSGSQPTTVLATPTTVRYESGKVTQQESTKLLSVDGDCR